MREVDQEVHYPLGQVSRVLDVPLYITLDGKYKVMVTDALRTTLI